jgi:hypothetical protein
MILDDLFNFAAQNSTSTPKKDVTVQADVTTNHTDGWQSTTNTAAVQPALTLNYSPGRGRIPADFQGGGLTITGPSPLSRNHSYTIEWQGNTFAANVDGTTNIVYGAAGQQFITISLCHALAFVNPV